MQEIHILEICVFGRYIRLASDLPFTYDQQMEIRKSFKTAAKKQMRSGGDAYLTKDLEDEIISFCERIVGRKLMRVKAYHQFA